MTIPAATEIILTLAPSIAARTEVWSGQGVRAAMLVRDVETKAPVAATGVSMSVLAPGGAVPTVHEASELEADGTGRWLLDIATDAGGDWRVRAECMGPRPAAAEARLAVRASTVAVAEPPDVLLATPDGEVITTPDGAALTARRMDRLASLGAPEDEDVLPAVRDAVPGTLTWAALRAEAEAAGTQAAGVANAPALAAQAAAEQARDGAEDAQAGATAALADAAIARAGAEAAEGGAQAFATAAQASATAAQASASTARLVVATAAELAANLNYVDATIAEVVLDGARNGTWRKYGASGAGEWLRTSTATIYTLAARTDAMPQWEQSDSPNAPALFLRSPGGKLLAYIERVTGYWGVGAGLLLPSPAGADSGRAVVAWSRNRKPLLEWSVYRESWVMGRMEATLATIGTLRATTVIVPAIDMRAGGADGRMWPLAHTPLGKILLGIEWDGTIVGRFDIASSMLASDDVPTGLGQPDAHGVTALSGRLMRFQGRDEMGVARSYRARRTTPPVAIQEARGPLLLVHRDGQSLSVGRQGAGGGHTTAPLPHNLLMFNAGIRGVEGAALTASALTDFAPAAEVENATHGDTGMVAGARWYHARLLADGRPRRVMLLRSHGQGGSTIAQAQPGQTKFTNGETEARRAVAIAAEYGLRVECSDWSFNQGQSDPTLSKEDYLALLETYHAAYVASRRATTGQDYDPLMFIEPVCASRDEVFEGPLLAQIAFAAANPGAVFLTAPYYHLQGATGLADSVHYSGPGYALIGEYTWRARYMVRELGVAWTGVQPAGAVQVSGNVLSLPLTHPSGATLQFDTATLPDAFGTKGLRVVDATASITGVALAPVNATRTDLVVTLDGAPTSPVVGIRCAIDKVGSVTDRACAWANIRDNDATPSLAVPGQYLRNWLTPFLATTE